MSVDSAIADFTAAIRVDPSFAEAFCNRGQLYDLSSRGIDTSEEELRAKAIADFTEAIRINPNYAEAYYLRGDKYSTAGSRVLTFRYWGPIL